MIQFKLYKDQIRTLGEVDRLGLPYDKLEPQYALDKDYSGWFSFTRLCFSLGDWAVISGLPEALKIKYPKIKIALPSRKYIEQIFGHIIDQWSYGSNNPLDYIDTIFKNFESRMTKSVEWRKSDIVIARGTGIFKHQRLDRGRKQ